MPSTTTTTTTFTFAAPVTATGIFGFGTPVTASSIFTTPVTTTATFGGFGTNVTASSIFTTSVTTTATFGGFGTPVTVSSIFTAPVTTAAAFSFGTPVTVPTPAICETPVTTTATFIAGTSAKRILDSSVKPGQLNYFIHRTVGSAHKKEPHFNEVSFEWVIPDFLSWDTTGILESPEFRFSSLSFNLILHFNLLSKPLGNLGAIYLATTESRTVPKDVCITVAVRQSGERRCYEWKELERLSERGFLYACPKFLEMSYLIDHKSEFLPFGRLTIECSLQKVKRESFKDKAKCFASPVMTQTIKFNPATGTDTMMKGGMSTNISTRRQYITSMEEYENKSFEELRVEYYAIKATTGGMAFGGTSTTQQTSLFGATPAVSSSGFSFSNITQSKLLVETTGLKSLVSDFKDLYLTKSLCDVTIKVKDVEFKAHKTILAARSSVFASAIEHDMLEKNTGVINIDNCDPYIFEDFLQYLYTGEIGHISLKTAHCLYVTADKYNVKELKSSCTSYMLRNLAVDNVCDVIALADLHDEITLMSSAEDYFRRHYSKIVSKAGWELLLKKNYRLANKVLQKVVSRDEPPKTEETFSFGSS